MESSLQYVQHHYQPLSNKASDSTRPQLCIFSVQFAGPYPYSGVAVYHVDMIDEIHHEGRKRPRHRIHIDHKYLHKHIATREFVLAREVYQSGFDPHIFLSHH
jgi:hypothetical protein